MSSTFWTGKWGRGLIDICDQLANLALPTYPLIQLKFLVELVNKIFPSLYCWRPWTFPVSCTINLILQLKRIMPDRPFTIVELHNPSFGIPELHKIRRSPDREALKLRKGLSGDATVSALCSIFGTQKSKPRTQETINCSSFPFPFLELEISRSFYLQVVLIFGQNLMTWKREDLLLLGFVIWMNVYWLQTSLNSDTGGYFFSFLLLAS